MCNKFHCIFCSLCPQCIILTTVLFYFWRFNNHFFVGQWWFLPHPDLRPARVSGSDEGVQRWLWVTRWKFPVPQHSLVQCDGGLLDLLWTSQLSWASVFHASWRVSQVQRLGRHVCHHRLLPQNHRILESILFKWLCLIWHWLVNKILQNYERCSVCLCWNEFLRTQLYKSYTNLWEIQYYCTKRVYQKLLKCSADMYTVYLVWIYTFEVLICTLWLEKHTFCPHMTTVKILQGFNAKQSALRNFVNLSNFSIGIHQKYIKNII